MSLFRRVTRHRIGNNQDPRENRLTEITAAVLERVDGLALDVMDAVLATAATAANDRLFDVDGDEAELWQTTLNELEDQLLGLRALSEPRLRVSTQRTTASGKFVDLELRFSPQPFATTGDSFVFWLEVKHGAGVHGTQLTDYLTDIGLDATDHGLVLMLAPRQSVPDITEVPETMPVVEWQAVAAVAARWSKRPVLGEVERFLLNDYLAYLAEEGLMDEGLLTTEHTFVLRAERAASATVAKLMELTDAHIAEHWSDRGKYLKRTRSTKPRYGTDYWAHYEVVPRDGCDAPTQWRSTTLEWGLFDDTSRDDPRNAWVFVAGATFWEAKQNPAGVPENATWLADRRAAGFEYVNDGVWRLFRFRYPEELLSATTLDDQANLLGNWVVESFRLLADAPPPN